MPTLDGLTTRGGAGNVAAALLILQAGTLTLDTASALNSSPWTSENFGADPEKAKSCREYVIHSIGVSLALCGIAGYVARSWVPVLTSAVFGGYLWWLYERALKRGAAAGSGNWAHG